MGILYFSNYKCLKHKKSRILVLYDYLFKQKKKKIQGEKIYLVLCPTIKTFGYSMEIERTNYNFFFEIITICY